jgi:hypothetical protein
LLGRCRCRTWCQTTSITRSSKRFWTAAAPRFALLAPSTIARSLAPLRSSAPPLARNPASHVRAFDSLAFTRDVLRQVSCSALLPRGFWWLYGKVAPPPQSPRTASSIPCSPMLQAINLHTPPCLRYHRPPTRSERIRGARPCEAGREESALLGREVCSPDRDGPRRPCSLARAGTALLRHAPAAMVVLDSAQWVCASV